MTSLRNESGQLLIVTVCIMVVLGISVAAIIFLNQTSTQHMMMSRLRQKSQTTTEEGLAYAMSRLSVPATWNAALAGNFDPDFNGVVISTGPGGGRFTIACSTGGNLNNYQVRINVVGYTGITSPTLTPYRALEAVISQKSISAALPTGLQASAALSLQNAPQIWSGGNLDVQWGSILVNDTGLWTVSAMMDSARYPRKFSLGGITGTSYTRAPTSGGVTSDQKEYWAFASLGFSPVLDFSYYSSTAAEANGFAPANGGVLSNPPGSGYFVGNATFTASGSAYTVPASTSVLFIEGDADFENAAFDLKQTSTQGGAVIVDGNLTLGNNSAGAYRFAPAIGYRVPSAAASEYPYDTSPGGMWPCHGYQGGLCPGGTGPPGIDFRGLLYVKNKLTVQTNQTWIIQGVVMVDGVLKIEPGAQLQVYYDDEINHQVHTGTFQLQVDSERSMPVR